MNVVILYGTVAASYPTTRELPSGSNLMSIELVTADDTGTSNSVPVAWFDPPADAHFQPGEQLVVIGTVRRRFYRSNGLTQSRVEVVADTITTDVAAILTAAERIATATQ